MKYHVTPGMTTGKKEDRPLRGGGAVSNSTLVSSPISENSCFELYPVSVKLKRPFTGKPPKPPKRSGTTIQGFSEKSRGRLRFTATNARNLLKNQFGLTYHDYWPIDGRQFKSDLHRFLVRAGQIFPDLKYLWVAEFQSRGAPHVHLFTNLETTKANQEKLANIWCRIVEPNDEKLRRFHLHSKNFINWKLGTGSYLCKYLEKSAQKEIPQGFNNFGRWWGNSRDLIPEPEIITQEEIEDELPEFDKETGEIFTPSWKYLVRTVGRYHEHCNRRSWFRKTNRSTMSLTGAPVFLRTLEYLQAEQGLKEPPSPF